MVLASAASAATTTIFIVNKILLGPVCPRLFLQRLYSCHLTDRFRVASMSTSSTSPSRPKVIVITGPTAVGKSNLALTLCRNASQSVTGEIITVDSVQVYRALDIGSNKPSKEEQAEVPHHLLDVLEPNAPEAFTAGDFVRKAEEAIDDALARGRIPVVVGGTSMYTQWLVQGRPDAPKSDPEVELKARGILAPFQNKNDWEGGLALLAARNPDRASKLHANDWYRLERALEVTFMTSPPSSFSSSSSCSSFNGVRSQSLTSKYDFRCFFLIAPREELCHVIDQRCLQMVEKGLLEETASLLSAGVLDPSSPPGRAIGYRQAIEYLSKEGVKNKEEEAVALKLFLKDFATATRRYAKQQMVWYRAQPEFIWLRWNLLDLAPALASLHASFKEDEMSHFERRRGGAQEALRKENMMEGKRMKAYTSKILEGLTGDKLETLVRRATDCRAQVLAAAAAADKR